MTVGEYILRRSSVADWYGEIWGRRVYFEKVGSSGSYWHVRVGQQYLKTPIVNVVRTFHTLDKAVAAVDRWLLAKRRQKATQVARELGKNAALRFVGKTRKQQKRARKAKKKRELAAKVAERKVRLIREKGIMRRVNTEWDVF